MDPKLVFAWSLATLNLERQACRSTIEILHEIGEKCGSVWHKSVHL